MQEPQSTAPRRPLRRLIAVLLPLAGILVTIAVLVGSYTYARAGLRSPVAAGPTIPIAVFLGPTSTAVVTAGPVQSGRPSVRGPDGLYTSTDVPQPIPDNNRKGALSRITVPDRLPMGSVRVVNLHVSHPDTGQLVVKLLAPDLTLLTLLTGICPGGHNWAALTLDAAADPAGAGCTDNLSGARRPDAAAELAALRGLDAQGDWLLNVVDTQAGGTGTLEGWSLQFGPLTDSPTATPAPATPAGP